MSTHLGGSRYLDVCAVWSKGLSNLVLKDPFGNIKDHRAHSLDGILWLIDLQAAELLSSGQSFGKAARSDKLENKQLHIDDPAACHDLHGATFVSPQLRFAHAN